LIHQQKSECFRIDFYVLYVVQYYACINIIKNKNATLSTVRYNLKYIYRVTKTAMIQFIDWSIICQQFKFHYIKLCMIYINMDIMRYITHMHLNLLKYLHRRSCVFRSRSVEIEKKTNDVQARCNTSSCIIIICVCVCTFFFH